MTQLKGKVNHFGKTDVSNLYKNQQITYYLDPVFMSFETTVAISSQPTVPITGLFLRPRAKRGDQKFRP